MFLGRSTPQWLALTGVIATSLQVIILAFVPGLDPVQVGLVIGAVVGLANGVLLFLANTATTPIKDPQLQEGTSVRVTDSSGTVIGSSTVQPPIT